MWLNGLDVEDLLKMKDENSRSKLQNGTIPPPGINTYIHTNIKIC